MDPEVQKLVDEFKENTKDMPLDVVPLKYLREKYKENRKFSINKYHSLDDFSLLHIHKDKYFYKCCKNRVDEFIRLGLNNYFMITIYKIKLY